VGLSACLLYSLANNGESARIVTKRLHNYKSTVADFIMGENGKLSVSQEIEVDLAKFRCGEIKLPSAKFYKIPMPSARCTYTLLF
jgi:hypothetical protein